MARLARRPALLLHALLLLLFGGEQPPLPSFGCGLPGRPRTASSSLFSGVGPRAVHAQSGPRKLAVLGIPSRPQDHARRDAIRRTWARAPPEDMEVLFILGDESGGGSGANGASATTPPSPPPDASSPDVVFVPVEESYRNVILKVRARVRV